MTKCWLGGVKHCTGIRSGSVRLYLVLLATFQRLRWSRGSVLAFGTQVRGFKPDRSRRIFQGENILSTPSFGREVKPFVPCRRFTACKRSLNVTWKSGIFRQNSSTISRPSSSSFHYQGLWWRHLVVQVGTTKDQGLYNKPSAAVHQGALAAGTLPQYNTIPSFCCNQRCWSQLFAKVCINRQEVQHYQPAVSQSCLQGTKGLLS